MTALGEERSHLGEARDASPPAENAALHGRHRVGERERPLEGPAAELPDRTGSVKDVARAVGVHDGHREARHPDEGPASRPIEPSAPASPPLAPGRGPRAPEALLQSSRPVTWATKRGLHTRRSTPGHTASMPSTTRSPSIVTRMPASRAHRTATAAAAGVDAVHVEEPARRDDCPVELVGPDVIRRRPAIEAGPEAGMGVDQHDADVAGAAARPERPAHVHPVAGEEPPTEPGPVVVAELPDVARAEAQAGARHHEPSRSCPRPARRTRGAAPSCRAADARR